MIPVRYELTFTHDIFVAIVPGPSGTIWTSQCGGTYCAHPEIEGHLYPLPLDWLPDPDPLQDAWASHAECGERQHLLAREFLDKSGMFPCALDLDYEDRWGEAWIPVVLPRKTKDINPIIAQLTGARAILTYYNSD